MSAFLEVRARAKAAGIGDDVVIAFQKFDTDASGDIDVEELRYALEADAAFVQANDLMEGDHPLEATACRFLAT